MMSCWIFFKFVVLSIPLNGLVRGSGDVWTGVSYVPIKASSLPEKTDWQNFPSDFNATNATKVENKTLVETHKKLQRIANITIAQFINNHTRRNLSFSELMELKELGDSLMDPNFMISNFFKKSNSHLITLPSTTMMNLASAILKSDFMPMSIIQRKKPQAPKDQNNKNETMSENKNKTELALTNATMDEALSTMTFHRKMMNEFLCKNYIAESILQALEKDAAIFGDHSEEFSDRLGELKPETPDPQAEMITDLGSTRYKDWLDKSSELTDIYKSMGGFDPKPYIVKEISPSDLPMDDIDHHADRKKGDDDDDEEDEDEDAEEDEEEKKPRKKIKVKKKKNKKKKPKPKPEEEDDDGMVEEEEEEESDEENDSGYNVYDTHLHSANEQFEVVDSGWNIFKFGFIDFYDSALTALAFLTFGIFTLQVFINLITNANAPRMGILVNNSTAAAPVNKRRALDLEQINIMSTTERMYEAFADSPLGVSTGQNRSQNFKSDMANLPIKRLPKVETSKTLNFSHNPTFEIIFGLDVTPSVELEPDEETVDDIKNQQSHGPRFILPEEVVAKFALVTIRAALKKDDPRCVRAALCRANRATLQFEGPPRLWLPMWSVGMSWMAQRAGGDPGSQDVVTGALENLKASVLGLAGVKCEKVYPPCE